MATSSYWRPIPVRSGDVPAYQPTARTGALTFATAQHVTRDGPGPVTSITDLPSDARATLTGPRPSICGLDPNRPAIMGIVNTTPDSFSDGGKFASAEDALAHAIRLIDEGADIIDIGGESTRPGADTVPTDEEIARTLPVIRALRERGATTPISIDTRKAAVARAAIEAGANLINDVSALEFDPDLATVAADTGTPVCLMHASASPKDMQNRTTYDNLLLDICDYLGARIDIAVAAGIPRDEIIIDPGIGFGKTTTQNLEIIRNLSLFHSLGAPVLLGASRKRFVGEITNADAPADRLAGSLAIAIEAARQGARIIRVHDVAETRQALAMVARL